MIYIATTSITGDFEKQIVQTALLETDLKTTELPKSIYQEKRGNLTISVNYSSAPFDLKIPLGQKIILGKKMLQPGEVTIWMKTEYDY